jgi:molybdopterin converting factor small subunit
MRRTVLRIGSREASGSTSNISLPVGFGGIEVNIEVLFFGRLREVTGIKETRIGLDDDASLQGLIDSLSAKYGVAIRDELRKNEFLQIQVNGKAVSAGDNNGLNEGDTVSIVLIPGAP